MRAMKQTEDSNVSRPEASPLGKPVSYRSEYAPDLLFPISRQLKREELGVRADALPFSGVDLWNAYEISWLDPRGKPVVALGTFTVPADSPFLIESKSLKLYLNSFNQSRFASVAEVGELIARDLSAAAGGMVGAELYSLSDSPQRRFGVPEGVLLDTLDVEIDMYRPEPRLLVADAGGDEVTETLYSHLLKSNCLVTGQPDWGTVAVRYQGGRIDPVGLLRYVVSFRNHDEFHEQCVERIFCDIRERCRPRHLAVWARYTRRGGLDINPFRSDGYFEAPGNVFEIRQ